MQIRRIVEKKVGKKVTTYFEAEIDGEIFRNQGIFRKLLGITNEDFSGLFSRREALRLTIGDDVATFKWAEDLYTIDCEQLQKTLQNRICEVKEWIATLTYSITAEVSVEV